MQLAALTALGILAFVMSNVSLRIHYWNNPDQVQIQEELPTESQAAQIQSSPGHFSQHVDTRMIDSFQVVCVKLLTFIIFQLTSLYMPCFMRQEWLRVAIMI